MNLATKIFGWVLLLSGLAIIGWTLMSSYNIFTGKAAVPEIFGIPKEEAKTPTAKGQITGIEDIQAQMEKMLSEQLKGVIPVDTMPKMLNLGVWAMLAGLLIFGGSQISGLGIKLIKK